jgi:hypothetical protein
MSSELAEPILEIMAPAIAAELIAPAATAIHQRDRLLRLARNGTAITSPEQAQRAAAFLRELADFTRTIEASRVSVKAPILDAGKKIDLTAKILVTDIEAEAKRIGAMLGAWTAEQERIAEEARRRAWQEQENIRLAAEKAEQEAREKARLEQEARDKAARVEQERLEKLANQARTEVARQRRETEMKEAAAKAEAERKAREEQEQAEAEKRRQETLAASAKAASAVTVMPKKIEGVATGFDLKFEVTDIRALHEAHPMFVLLSPNNAAIKAALKQLAEGQALPGVRHWKEAKTVVR